MKNLFRSLITATVTLMSLMTFANAYAEERFIAGKDYHNIPYAVPTRDESKIEVVELFWYGCGHCFKFEPIVHPWSKKLPADVDFYQQPGDFGGWSNETQLHYTMEALGILEKAAPLVFNEYHVLKNKLKSDAKRIKFFGMLGVSEADYTKAWNSFAVSSKVKVAQARTRSYRATGVPAIVVNGKFRIDTRSAGGFERMLKIADYLIAQERAAK